MPPKGAPKTMDELSGLIQTHYRSVHVQVLRGDITNIVAHVIVNAANTGLRGGGGIDGNIHRAAGSGLREELKQLYPNGEEVGKACATGAHNMQPRVRAIVHAIGPNYKGTTTRAQKEAKRVELRSAYLESLDAASNCKFVNGLTVVLPCISTGIFGFPMEEGANIALQTIHDWIETHPNPAKFERIVVLLFGDKDPNEPFYKKAFPIVFSDENNNRVGEDVEIRGGLTSPNLYLGEDSDGDVQMFWVWDNEAGGGGDEGKKGKGGEGGGGDLNTRRTAGGRLVCERDDDDEDDDSQDGAPAGTGGDPPSDDGGSDDGPEGSDSSDSSKDSDSDTDSTPSEPSSSSSSSSSSNRSDDSIVSNFDTSDDEDYIEGGQNGEEDEEEVLDPEEFVVPSPTVSAGTRSSISSDSNKTPTPPPMPPPLLPPPASSSSESSSDDEDSGDPQGAPARGTRQVVCGLPKTSSEGNCIRKYTYRGGPLGCHEHKPK